MFLTDADGRKIGEKVFKHGGEGLAEMAAWLMATSGAAEACADPGRDRGAARPRGRDAARARLQGARHQSQADGSLPRPLHAGRRQGRQPRRRGDGLGLAHRSALLPAAGGRRSRSSSNCASGRASPRTSAPSAIASPTACASSSGATFPAMLELDSDLGAEWLLDLWETAPTPDKAARIRETTIAKLLKRHRIRRFDAAHVLGVLRQPPVKVAAGTTEAASAHIATLDRTHPPRQPAAQGRPPPARCPDRPPHPGRGGRAGAERSSVTWRSSHPCREWEGSSSPRCSQKPSMPCSGGITPPCAV